MNITILNGNPDPQDKNFDRYLGLYRIKMHNTGHYVRYFMLREMQIHDLRTQVPSSEKDDFRYLANSLEDTDLLVIASPIRQGFISVLSKMILDRLVRHYDHPVAENVIWNELQASTKKVPLMGMILQKDAETDEQDILLNRLSAERTAANIHTVLDFCITTDNGVTEAACKTFQSVDYYSYIEKTYTDLITGASLQ
jgi:hypothetical protein